MIFQETKLKGSFIINIENKNDKRGFFARAFCAKEFKKNDINNKFVQANISYSRKRGTLRGMHYQIKPASESKFIRCINGAVLDVIIDMRPESRTYLQHIEVELSSENRTAIYVPSMFAHGNQALTDDVELFYFVDRLYNSKCERGVRYDDPLIGIKWPLVVTEISDKDLQIPFINHFSPNGKLLD